MKKFIPGQFEARWQKKWAKDKLYKTDLQKPNKYYVLAEFAYPSGDLHMGHWFTFSGADIFARFKRMQDRQVFFPNGFDAFGLPAENAAIKNNIHPQDWTMNNIARMKEQFATMGASFDFDYEVITCLPEYYRWNQWIFLKILEKGLAYRGSFLANWCPSCQTVLANEGVEAGLCWRCSTEVVQKDVEQWFFKITAFAQRLIWPDEPNVNWPQSLREAQNNWIGKSEGALVKFDNLEVFTTRPDTIFGATFIVISPEHPLLANFVVPEKKKIINKYVAEAKKKSEVERKENKNKSGVFSGSYVKNPLTGQKIPVWIADYVLPGYGTGAIMAVPAHDSRDFEFAKKHNLEIKTVIAPQEQKEDHKLPKAFEEAGILANSGQYSGLSSDLAQKKISDYLEKHHLGKKQAYYHLRDWSISRQRYWGTPIPVVHCPKCGIIPVPEQDLPVELPFDVDYTPKGKSPLASNENWLEVKCPKCKENTTRDPDTMDTFVDSSWYFFRFLSPKYHEGPFDTKVAQKIMPVDIYFGGAEHNLGHTLYSRFFTKFFHDLGLSRLEEYALRRINHGIVLGPDGNKMSKSKGNVVNPDDEVKKFGADAVRVHMAFFMPYEGSSGPWISERIWGPYRFLDRVWQLFDKVTVGHPRLDVESVNIDSGSKPGMTIDDLMKMHKTIKKVGEDIENIRFNTAVAALMEWLNYLSRRDAIGREEYRVLLLLLAPFAPHITEELWEMLGEKYSIHQQSWPKYEEEYLDKEDVTIIIQVNGRVRDQILIQKDIASSREVVENKAKESPKVQKFLAGEKIQKVVFVPVKIINFVLASE